MKEIVLILILFSSFCYSQENKSIELEINRIDSICSKIRPKMESDGVIELRRKKSKRIIGNGGYSISIYTHNFEISNNKSPLIKANFHQKIDYKKSYSENILGEFYYQNNELFLIKIKLSRVEKNKEELAENFYYTISELNNSKSIKNIFLFEIKSWVKEKNNEILEFYNLK